MPFDGLIKIIDLTLTLTFKYQIIISLFLLPPIRLVRNIDKLPNKMTGGQPFVYQLLRPFCRVFLLEKKDWRNIGRFLTNTVVEVLEKPI